MDIQMEVGHAGAAAQVNVLEGLEPEIHCCHDRGDGDDVDDEHEHDDALVLD
jgi:hypothetical protein